MSGAGFPRLMNKMTIYDPAMCCSTGVCGPAVDPALVQFAGFLAQMKERGVRVERYNLAQQPMAFARSAEVRDLLQKEGPEVLPLIFIDEVLAMKGRYPEHEERAAWIRDFNRPAEEASS